MRTALLSLVGFLFASPMSYAADGSFDPTWAGGGRVTFPGNPSSPTAPSGSERLIVQPGGNLLLGGYANVADSSYGMWWVGQLFASGATVLTFGESNGSGVVTGPYFSDNLRVLSGIYFTGMALQSDGRIVATNSNQIARMTSDGHALDTAGVAGGTGYATVAGIQIDDVKGTFGALNGLAQQPSGKWLLAGSGKLAQVSTIPDFAVIRLNTDFSLDTTFNAVTDGSTGVTFAGGQIVSFNAGGGDLAFSVLPRPDGSFILVGVASSASSTVVALAGLDANGALDPSFGGSGTGKTTLTWNAGVISPAFEPGSAKLDRAGRIVLASGGHLTGQAAEGMVVIRLMPDGTPDTAFGVPSGTDGVSFHAFAFCENGSHAISLAFDSAGRIVAAGQCLHTDFSTEFLLERLHGDDGSLDTTFGISGISHGSYAPGATANGADDIAFDASGHPVFAGTTTVSDVSNVAVGRVTYDLIFTDNFSNSPSGRLPGQ